MTPPSETVERSALREALASRDFRLLLTGMAVSEAGSWLYGVALLVYVFEQTRSPGWVAAATILRTVPYVVLGPLGGVVADRYDRRVVMIASDLSRAVLMFLLAASAASSFHAAVVIGLAFMTAAAGAAYGPSVAALTPSVVSERALAGANASMGTIEHTALIVGPALGGLLLVLGSAATAFFVNGVTFLFSASCIAFIRTRGSTFDSPGRQSVGGRMAEGLSAITSSPQITIVVGFVFAASFLYGHESVLLVFVSERLLGTGSEGVGFLNAAIGAGGVLAAGATSRLARSDRSRRVLTLGIAASALPLAIVSAVGSQWIAYGLMGLIGAGSIAFEVVSMTLLQRGIPRDVLARVFGILDSLAIAGVMLGSLVAPLLVSTIGLRATLVVVGTSIPLLVIALTPGLKRLEARAASRSEELAPVVDALTRSPIFAGAPLPALEGLAAATKRELIAPGTIVLREGEPADDVFLVLEGSLAVSAAGEGRSVFLTLGELGPGDHFGEIGIVEELPRTATVTALTDCDILRIPGADFVAAIHQAPTLSGTLVDGIVGRLSRTHPDYRPNVAGQEEP